MNRPLRSMRLGQLSSWFNTDPFHGVLPSPASEAAAGGGPWQPTEDAKHLPDLTARIYAGTAVAAIIAIATLVSR